MIENNVILPKKTIFSGLEKFVSGLKEIRLHGMTPSEKSRSEFISDRWFFWTFMVSQSVMWTWIIKVFKSHAYTCKGQWIEIDVKIRQETILGLKCDPACSARAAPSPKNSSSGSNSSSASDSA